MRVYIAGPFFTEDEQKAVGRIELLLEDHDVFFFSPRSFGVLIEMSEEEKQKRKSEIFQKNIEMIDTCDKMVAIIDNRDIGTMWEMGYAYAKGIPVISYSGQGYGLNVMLAESVVNHNTTLAGVIEDVLGTSYRKNDITGVY